MKKKKKSERGKKTTKLRRRLPEETSRKRAEKTRNWLEISSTMARRGRKSLARKNSEKEKRRGEKKKPKILTDSLVVCVLFSCRGQFRRWNFFLKGSLPLSWLRLRSRGMSTPLLPYLPQTFFFLSRSGPSRADIFLTDCLPHSLSRLLLYTTGKLPRVFSSVLPLPSPSVDPSPNLFRLL